MPKQKKTEIVFQGDSIAEIIEAMEHTLARMKAHVEVPELAAKLGFSVGPGRDGRPRIIAPTVEGGV